jgi:hypothetical protein
VAERKAGSTRDDRRDRRGVGAELDQGSLAERRELKGPAILTGGRALFVESQLPCQLPTKSRKKIFITATELDQPSANFVDERGKQVAALE